MDRRQLLAPQRPNKITRVLKQPKSSYTDEDLDITEFKQQDSSIYSESTVSMEISTELNQTPYMRFGPIQLFYNYNEKQKFRTLLELDDK